MKKWTFGCIDLYWKFVIRMVNHICQTHFCTILDSEMKRLNSTGQYIHKRQAEPITVENKNRLWDLGLLGDTSPSVLLHMLVYMVGLYFALRSESEHRRLRYSSAQIQLIEKPGSWAYLSYQENISKTNQGGLTSRSKKN